MYPAYTVRERIADGCVHVFGVTASIVAVITLLIFAIPTLPADATVSLVIYGVAMIAMFSFSAAYNLVSVPSWKGILRRFDQAAIFVKIAGTYTPFALVKMGGAAGYTLLSSVWVVALVGAVAKLLPTPRWDRLSVPLYLALGWAGVFAIQPLVLSVPLDALILLGIGGVLYSVGVIFHVWESLPYQNAIWHLFVLVATVCHFAAVVTAIFE